MLVNDWYTRLNVASYRKRKPEESCRNIYCINTLWNVLEQKPAVKKNCSFTSSLYSCAVQRHYKHWQTFKLVMKTWPPLSMPSSRLSAPFPAEEVRGLESCAVQREALMEVLQNSPSGGVEISRNPTPTSSRPVIKHNVLTYSATSIPRAWGERAVPWRSAGTHHHGNR